MLCDARGDVAAQNRANAADKPLRDREREVRVGDTGNIDRSAAPGGLVQRKCDDEQRDTGNGATDDVNNAADYNADDGKSFHPADYSYVKRSGLLCRTGTYA